MHITEDFLHYVWKYKLFEAAQLVSTSGDTIEVLSVGSHNKDAGPDFFNARLRIGNTVWAGNIEVHIKASDWLAHKHHTNKAYDNVILHLVYELDVEPGKIATTEGEDIPVAKMYFDHRLLHRYQQLLASPLWVPCADTFAQTDSFVLSYWLGKLLIERLEQKSEHITELLQQTVNHAEEVFYRHIASCFGFKTNAVPFEMLAKSLPLKYLGKHKNNLLQIEAMLFGQAGMLTDSIDNDPYYDALRREYNVLKAKFELVPIEPHLWKFMRMRPANFPTIRIAQFAMLIHKSSALLSAIVDILCGQQTDKTERLRTLFDVATSEYWLTHYRFGKASAKRSKQLGSSAFNTLLVNGVATFMFAYARQTGNEPLADNALGLFDDLPAEKNAITDGWQSLGTTINSAAQSQAFLQLKNEYCNPRRCLECAIGSKTLVAG